MTSLDSVVSDVEDDDGYDDSDSDSEAPLLVQVDESAVLSAAATTTTTDDDDDDDDAPPTTSAEENLPPCPVTILSGFLGSGKTTLIQYILQSPNHGKRIAVIENEFGGGDNEQQGLAVESIIARDGIDTNSNKSSPLVDLIDLPNGCVCCTVKDSLITALEALVDKRRDLDYIIIECSGMANPGPIASIFWLDDALESRIRLDGIITLIDSKNILHQLRETEEAAQQIAYADRLILNKIDLIDVDNNNSAYKSIESIVREIRTIHPTAPLRQTTYSSIPDLDWILDAKCFDGDRIKEVEDFMNSCCNNNNHNNNNANDDDDLNGHGHSHDHDHNHHQDSEDSSSCTLCYGGGHLPQHQQHNHRHTKAVSTVALIEHGSVDLKRLNRWFADVLWPNQDEQEKVLRKLLEQPQTSSSSSSINNNATAAATSDGDGETSTTATSTKTQQQIFRMKGIVSVRHRLDSLGEERYDDGDDDDDDEMVAEKQAQEKYVDHETGIDSRRYIVQAVYDLWDVYPTTTTTNDSKEEEREDISSQRIICKLVIIGRALDETSLRQGFLSCFV